MLYKYTHVLDTIKYFFTMRLRTYHKYIEYVKSTGVCIVVVGGCWFLYQLRQVSHVLQSSVPTNVLSKDQPHTRYIYIDDPRFKDVLMLRKVENLQSSVPAESFSFAHIIMKWWKSLTRNVAYRLLHIAQSGNDRERLKALNTLNSLKHLKDWHYRHIAQMLDAKTAVSLARMPNVDSRFFLQTPYRHVQYNLQDIIEKVYQLLLHLNTLCENTHPCLLQFLNKNFKDIHSDSLILDHDLTNLGLAVAPAIVWDQELLQNCVQALCHHSCLELYSKDIIDAGGLPLLMIIKKIFNDNINICILLAKIISNISLHSMYLQDIFQSGWIGTLVEWTQNSDIRLAAAASRALANLDMDENNKYPRRIYLLHPLHKTVANTKLDVIFLHGLLGGVFITWRQRDPDTSEVGVLQRIRDSFVNNPTYEYTFLPGCAIVNTRLSIFTKDPNDPNPINPERYDQTYQENSVNLTMIDPYIIQDGINFSNLVDDQSQDFLRDLTYDLRKREWDKVGHDFEVILDDCPQSTNSRGNGPFFCQGNDTCMKKIYHDRQHKTQCWPKDWLPQDIPFVRVIGVNYDTNLSLWTSSCPIEDKNTMGKRSKEYIKKLLIAGVGKRPTVWVCHSMGGLLVKKMLVDEWRNGDQNNICKNTRGIVFYSTPHRGSRVAALKQATQMVLWPSIEVQELREESPQLLKLHNEFLDMLKDYPIEITSFSETKSTHVTPLNVPFQFVTSNSADPGVGEFYEIAQDHLSICKPASRHSFLYQKLLSVLKCHVTHEKTTVSPIAELLALPNKLL